jgi:hypothetical protein
MTISESFSKYPADKRTPPLWTTLIGELSNKDFVWQAITSNFLLYYIFILLLRQGPTTLPRVGFTL